MEGFFFFRLIFLVYFWFIQGLLFVHWLSREVVFQTVTRGSRLHLIVSEIGNFQITEAKKEKAEGNAATLKYFGMELTSLLFNAIVQN